MKPVKNAVAFVVYGETKKKVLAIKRPADDIELPNAWGLPAGSVKQGESEEQAVLRAGIEKLGVQLEITKPLAEGLLERKDYSLHLRNFEAKIMDGIPSVPQPVEGVTQYAALKWARLEELIPAAKKGSLCTRLFLE